MYKQKFFIDDPTSTSGDKIGINELEELLFLFYALELTPEEMQTRIKDLLSVHLSLITIENHFKQLLCKCFPRAHTTGGGKKKYHHKRDLIPWALSNYILFRENGICRLGAAGERQRMLHPPGIQLRLRFEEA